MARDIPYMWNGKLGGIRLMFLWQKRKTEWFDILTRKMEIWTLPAILKEVQREDLDIFEWMISN